MNEIILNKDGTVTRIGDAGSVNIYFAKQIKKNTTPAVYNSDGSVKTNEVVPDISTLAVQITEADLKTHAWRLPKARTERLEDIRSARDRRLKEMDVEYQLADEGVHPDGLSKAQVAAKKVKLRDLPTSAETELGKLSSTDDISAYTPDEIK